MTSKRPYDFIQRIREEYAIQRIREAYASVDQQAVSPTVPPISSRQSPLDKLIIELPPESQLDTDHPGIGDTEKLIFIGDPDGGKLYQGTKPPAPLPIILPDTRVAFGSPSDEITSSPNITFNNSANLLSVAGSASVSSTVITANLIGYPNNTSLGNDLIINNTVRVFGYVPVSGVEGHKDTGGLQLKYWDAPNWIAQANYKLLCRGDGKFVSGLTISKLLAPAAATLQYEIKGPPDEPSPPPGTTTYVYRIYPRTLEGTAGPYLQITVPDGWDTLTVTHYIKLYWIHTDGASSYYVQRFSGGTPGIADRAVNSPFIDDGTTSSFIVPTHDGSGYVKVDNVLDMPDSQAATAAGLTAGMVFRTGDVLRIVATPATTTGVITADNGLTANTASNVRLGGTLIQNTILDTSSQTCSLAIGRNNTLPASKDTVLMFGVANSYVGPGLGCTAIGAAHTIGGDFSLAAGYGNITTSKSSIGLGDSVKTLYYGEVAISSGVPSGTVGVGGPAGACQTSIITFFRRYTGSILQIGYPENRNTDGSIGSGSFGLSYYQVTDNTILFVQGRMSGIDTATPAQATVWTIDTWIKNAGGTITTGTSAFTQVVKDANFSGLTAVTLTFSAEGGASPNAQKMNVTVTGGPMANYVCTMTINKNSKT